MYSRVARGPHLVNYHYDMGGFQKSGVSFGGLAS